MKKYIIACAMLWVGLTSLCAQDINGTNDDGTFAAEGYSPNKRFGVSDSIQGQHKEVPKGIKMWTIDERFGDRIPTQPDTLSHMYQNTVFNTGMRGEYNSLGNLGSPRINRIFIDRPTIGSEFYFIDPYDFVITPTDKFKFTSTLSPITNLTYNSAGNKVNGEDFFKAFFAVNAGKRLGLGFKFDYLYGRGYYNNQSASHINYGIWATYLGERYQAHLLLSLNHQKVAESGGIANDAYITHPESFSETFETSEIPTMLQKNWNRNDNQHVFFNHKYSLGFYRKVPMTKDEIEAKKFAIKAKKEEQENKAREEAKKRAEENGDEFDEEEFKRRQILIGRPDALANKDKTATNDSTEQWIKDEYVPVTSFIHTVKFDHFKRIYQAYETPKNFYANNYYYQSTAASDSIYDQTKHWALKNTFAIALLEGFNKWAKAGLKAFVSHELRHYELPQTYTTNNAEPKNIFGGYEKINKNDISVGGQLLKTAGKTLHYDVAAETWVAGNRAGQLHIDGHVDVNFPLFGDTVQLATTAFFHCNTPSFYMSEFRSRHFSWSNSLDKELHSRILGEFSLKKTMTKLRVGYDMLKNHTYFGVQNNRVLADNKYSIENYQVAVRQHKGAISLFTIQLQQDLKLGMFNWQNVITLQKSSNETVLPTPLLNIYSNLFIKFKIARVLKCDFGADLRYFTSYYAPEYLQGVGAFGIQETEASRTKIGNYPIVNVYANFHLQNTRFFIMMSHINQGNGGQYFFTPHHPLNERILRLGVSWNFFN